MHRTANDRRVGVPEHVSPNAATSFLLTQRAIRKRGAGSRPVSHAFVRLGVR